MAPTKRKGARNAAGIGLNFKVHEPWDLDNVGPDFFPMPASVIFAEYRGANIGSPLAPGTVQMWRGDWEKNYDSISRESEVLHHDDGKFKSPYADLSSNGATIQDRRLFFVETVPHTAMLPATNTTNVQTRLGKQDKVLYEGKHNQLDGVVSNEHLFDVYMGECIAPYVALDPLKAALPVHRSTMTMPLNHDNCEDDKHDHTCRLEVSALHHTMQRRWNNADTMFSEAHKDQEITELYSRLNHQKTLTSQLEHLQGTIADGETIRIAYTSSGEPTTSIIRDNHAILENALFQTVCNSESEAYYLLAIINSKGLATAAEMFMPRGLYGARHLHKHGWKLSIPRYEIDDPLHISLSELGKAAEEECTDLIANSDILTKPAGKAQSEPARKMLRHEWQPKSKTAQEIEAAVAKILSDPAQAKLAEHQMSNK